MSVRGPVPSSTLGVTLIHEHLLIDFLESPQVEENLENMARTSGADWNQSITSGNYFEMRWNPMAYAAALSLRDIDEVGRALLLLGENGGNTVVDVTPIGVGRNPEGLYDLASITGLNIVMGTGYLTRDFHPSEIEGKSANEIAAGFEAEFRQGVGPHSIAPGIIGEIGLSWPVDDQEQRVLEGGVRAQQALGLPLTIHPGRHPSAPMDAVRRVERAGGDLSRTAVCHLDRTLFELSDVLALAATGVYLEWDLFGNESRHYPLADLDLPNDAGRIQVIVSLFDMGHGHQVLISHDISSPLRFAEHGGEGYHHILKRVLPVMKQRGLTERDVHSVVVENPARFLSITGSAHVT